MRQILLTLVALMAASPLMALTTHVVPVDGASMTFSETEVFNFRRPNRRSSILVYKGVLDWSTSRGDQEMRNYQPGRFVSKCAENGCPRTYIFSPVNVTAGDVGGTLSISTENWDPESTYRVFVKQQAHLRLGRIIPFETRGLKVGLYPPTANATAYDEERIDSYEAEPGHLDVSAEYRFAPGNHPAGSLLVKVGAMGKRVVFRPLEVTILEEGDPL